MEIYKDLCLGMYEDLEETRARQNELISEVQKLDKDIEIKKLEYRLKSVSRVLDYIHSNLSIIQEQSFGNLITHCCNKLNGNIDGIEVDFNIEGKKLLKKERIKNEG